MAAKVITKHHININLIDRDDILLNRLPKRGRNMYDMKVEKERVFSHGFVLTQQELRRIFNIMIKRMEGVTGSDGFIAFFIVKYGDTITEKTPPLDGSLSQVFLV